ncbi:MAG: site-2 protease family protein [Archaeoglobaceae archaeon]
MKLEDHFYIYHSERIKDGMRYYVVPRKSEREIVDFLTELSLNYDVSLKQRYGELVLEIKRIRERKWINLALFIATFVSTTFFGSLLYQEPNILGGLLFSLAILSIFGSHEIAHYLVARKWRMRVSLPYFIPFPTIIGTLGAVIKQRGAIPSRKALIEVGASGPITGFFTSIIVSILGLGIAYEVELKGGEIMLGTPLIFELLINLTGFKGQVLHPIAFAGWVGFLLTFFNLLPVGQLDGGHVARALFGERSEIVSKSVPPFLIILGFFFGEIWLFWGIILLFFSTMKHPKLLNDERLDSKGILLGIFCYLIAALCFVPRPFYF